MIQSLCKWPALVMCFPKSSGSRGQLLAGLEGADTELKCLAWHRKGWSWFPLGCHGENDEGKSR